MILTVKRRGGLSAEDRFAASRPGSLPGTPDSARAASGGQAAGEKAKPQSGDTGGHAKRSSRCDAGIPLSLFGALCERPDACLAFLASPPERRAEWCREAAVMTKQEAGALAAAITKTVPELR